MNISIGRRILIEQIEKILCTMRSKNNQPDYLCRTNRLTIRTKRNSAQTNDGSIHWERHMQRQWKWLPNENGRTDTLCLIDCMLCVLSRIDKVGTMFVVRLCDNQTNIVCRRWRWWFHKQQFQFYFLTEYFARYERNWLLASLCSRFECVSLYRRTQNFLIFHEKKMH